MTFTKIDNLTENSINSGKAIENPIRARFLLPYTDFTLDIDLEFPSSGVTALFGVSGSVKTSLLRCVAGLEKAKVGELSVTMNESLVTSLAQKRVDDWSCGF